MAKSGLQPLALFLAIFPCVVCVILVSIRIWRKIKKDTYSLDDTLLIISTILNIGLSVTSSNYMLASYTGYHLRDIPPGAVDNVLVMKWNYANSVIYNPILALVKVSFVLTLINLQSPNRWINRCLWTTLVLNTCFAIAGPLAGIFQCTPVAKYWDPSITGGHCIDPADWIVSCVSFVLATDLLILIMPTWILYDLKMPFNRKFQVISFLSIGVIVTIVGAYRTSVLIKAFVIDRVGPNTGGTQPPNYDSTYSVDYTLCNIESGLAIIAACGPTIKFLLGFIIPSLRTTDQRSSKPYTHQGGSYGARYYINSNKRDGIFRSAVSGNDNFELDGVAEKSYHSNSDEIAITTTVAWRTEAEANQPDSHSIGEQKLRSPRTVL